MGWNGNVVELLHSSQLSVNLEPQVDGHLPSNTESHHQQHQHVAVPPAPTQYQFNLTGITPPVPPKWKHNENLLELPLLYHQNGNTMRIY